MLKKSLYIAWASFHNDYSNFKEDGLFIDKYIYLMLIAPAQEVRIQPEIDVVYIYCEALKGYIWVYGFW